jgi:hypothetical protein
MKIFNIGFNRAGSLSLTAALQALGYRSVHYLYDKKRLYDIMLANKKADIPLLTGIENYDAYLDFAGHHFFEILDSQYPGSKFIITSRNLGDWLDSRERIVLQNQADMNYRFHFTTVKRDAWIQERISLLSRTETYFKNRKNDILYLDIPGGDEWEPLCSFLNEEIPNLQFPFLNKM